MSVLWRLLWRLLLLLLLLVLLLLYILQEATALCFPGSMLWSVKQPA